MVTHGNPGFGFKTIWSGVRPPKVAVLISEESEAEQWLQVIDICSQTWGGMHFVVVPTDGVRIIGAFWHLLKLYDPDYVMELGSVKLENDLRREIKTTLNPFPGLPELSDPYFVQSISPDVTPYPLTNVSGVVNPSTRGYACPEVKAEPWLELLAYSHTGRLTPKTVDGLKERNIPVGYPDYDLLKNNPDRSDALLGLAWLDYRFRSLDEWGKLPRDLAMAHITEYHDINIAWHVLPVILVVGDSASDFCLFYSLSHMRPDVYWVPPTILDSVSVSDPMGEFSLPVNTAFHLAHHIHRRVTETSEGRPFLVTSISKEESALREDIQTLEKARLILSGITLPELANYQFETELLLGARHSAWESNNYLRSSSQAVQLVDGKSPGFLDVRPKHLTIGTVSPFFDNLAWISEISIQGYKLPALSAFNDQVLSFGTNAPSTRVTAEGIAYVGVKPFVLAGTDIDLMVAKPSVRVLESFDLFSRLFEKHGYEIVISDKGAYQEGTVQRFGGISSFADDFRSARGGLLKGYLDISSDETATSYNGTKIRGRRYLDFEDFAAQLGSDSNYMTLRTLNEYLDKKVLQRGFTLKCKECRQFDWYEIGSVSDVIHCSRCGRTQGYEPEAPWSYRLNELVFQCLKNRVDCHILTLDQIQLRAIAETFIYIPAFDVFNAEDRSKPILEVDLACILDGQLILGECKTKGSILRDDRRQLAKYEALAKEIQAGVLVLSTLAENWTDDAKRHIEERKGHLRKFNINLKEYAGAELL